MGQLQTIEQLVYGLLKADIASGEERRRAWMQADPEVRRNVTGLVADANAKLEEFLAELAEIPMSSFAEVPTEHAVALTQIVDKVSALRAGVETSTSDST